MSAFENLSISYISISLNQVIKAATPAGTILATYIFERKTFSVQLIVSTVIIVIGAIVTVANNPEVHKDGIYGIVFAVGSLIFSVIQGICSGMLMQRTNIDPIILTFVTSLPASISLVPAFVVWEYQTIQLDGHKIDSSVVPLILLSAVLALCYNLSHYLLINYTSAHYNAIAGNFKIIILIFISIVIFGTKIGFQTAIGMIIGIFGFFSYNYFKYQELKNLSGKIDEEKAVKTENLLTILRPDQNYFLLESSSESEEEIQRMLFVPLQIPIVSFVKTEETIKIKIRYQDVVKICKSFTQNAALSPRNNIVYSSAIKSN